MCDAQVENPGGSDQTIVADEEGSRLDVFLAARLPGLSRSKITKLIREGNATVNGKACKPSQCVELGDEIVLHLPPPPVQIAIPEPIEFEVIHEDDSIAVIDKPPGLVVHCTETMLTGTLVNGLLSRFETLSTVGGAMRRGIVHRLDKDTSGVMVVAKTDEAHIKLAAAFENREVQKQYLAIVHGRMEEDRYEIDRPIARNPHNRQLMTTRTKQGRASFTTVEVLERFDALTFVRASPRTGRTHQVRVHLSAIGHPIVADKQYGGRSMKERPKFGLTRQALHASLLGFNHPRSGEWAEFESPLPADMQAALETLREG